MNVRCKNCGAMLIADGKLTMVAVKEYEFSTEGAILDKFKVVCMNCGHKIDGEKLKQAGVEV